MLEAQYIRGILIVSNLVSFILSFIIGDFYFGLASVLLISWVQSVTVVSYTAYKLRVAKKEGYFRVPLHVDEFGIPLGDMAEKPKMGTVMTITTATMDFLFSITLMVLVPLSISAAWTKDEDWASMGGLVALVIHVFFAVSTIDVRAIRKYKIKVTIVPRNPESIQKAPAEAAEAAGKEQRTSEESSAEEPEQLSPRPYRGSPSTKPSKASNLSSDGPIRLIEPTDGDYLIAERS